MLPDPVADGAGLPVKTLFPQLPPELRGIVTSLLPALLNIAAMFVDGACMTARPPLWKAMSIDPVANGFTGKAAAARNLPLRIALPHFLYD